MENFDGRDFYMQWLCRIAYKILILNPWKKLNYFDFFLMELTQKNHTEKYILNLENYNSMSDKGKTYPMKTIWIHLFDGNDDPISRMSAYCCVYTSKENIPESYLEESQKWKKHPFSDKFMPFFIDMRDNTPKTLDFAAAKNMYYILNNSYNVLLRQKISGSQ
ncbi:MAG: hypothetical protein IJZ94_03930 [Clostridia bacterium]|nr:hypothetical protein [Clostridia bacterium]